MISFFVVYKFPKQMSSYALGYEIFVILEGHGSASSGKPSRCEEWKRK